MKLKDFVGQEKLKRAMEIFFVSNLKSILIVGDKGTGKSTYIDALYKSIDKKIYKIPLGASDDMIFGSVTLDDLIKAKTKSFQEGIIEKSRGEFILIDNINLFPKDTLKEIMDSIEYKNLNINRDGFDKKSYINTKLVGIMNPDEGYLSETIVEKIDIYVEMENILDSALRKDILKLNSLDNLDDSNEIDDEYISKLTEAKKRFNYVEVDENAINIATEIYEKSRAEGYRGLFNLIYASKAICALDKKRRVGLNEILEAVEYTLKHRQNEMDNTPPLSREDRDDNPEESPELGQECRDNNSESNTEREDINSTVPEFENEYESNGNEEKKSENGYSDSSELVIPNEIFEVNKLFDLKDDRKKRNGNGKRTKMATSKKRGKVVGSRYASSYEDIHILRTIMVGVMDGAYNYEEKSLKIDKTHLRNNKRKNRIGARIVFVVDSSKSMNAKKRMVETKNAILSLLMDSYIKRDEIAMISFSGNNADLILPFTNSPILAKRELENLETKGKTPLSDGLYRAYELIKSKKRKDKDIIPILVLITDGHANVGNIFKDDPISDAKYIATLIKEENIESLVIDTETGYLKLGYPREISEYLNANYYKLEDIKSDKISKIVRETADITISRVDIMED